MEKYGFVYIWYDCKREMYYIGSHWGYIEDGYICSSNRMRDAHRRRPDDFKRRIVEQTNKREELLDIEQKWLSLAERKKDRYYNLCFTTKSPWWNNQQSRLTVGQKISASPMRNQRISEANKGKKVSEDTKHKIRLANKKQFQDPEQIEMRKRKSKELWQDPEYIEKQKKVRSKEGFYKGFTGNHTKETKNKISKSKLGVPVHNKESKSKISKAFSNKIWINDGFINKRIDKNIEMPEGFVRGRIKK